MKITRLIRLNKVRTGCLSDKIRGMRARTVDSGMLTDLKETWTKQGAISADKRCLHWMVKGTQGVNGNNTRQIIWGASWTRKKYHSIYWGVCFANKNDLSQLRWWLGSPSAQSSNLVLMMFIVPLQRATIDASLFVVVQPVWSVEPSWKIKEVHVRIESRLMNQTMMSLESYRNICSHLVNMITGHGTAFWNSISHRYYEVPSLIIYTILHRLQMFKDYLHF